MTKYKGDCGVSNVVEHGTWVLSVSGRGVKQNKGGNNNNDYGNNTQLDHNVSGSTTCAFVGQGTKGLSDVQTCIPTMENMRLISYINVVPIEPSTILTSANDVTKGPGLSVNIKGHVSFSKLVNGEQSRKSANFHNLLWPAHNGANVVVSLEYVKNTWSKYELVKSKPLKGGLVTKEFVAITLKCVHPGCKFTKKDMGNVPVWVKLHNVPLTTFTEDVLSAIATKLGTPLMLDSYTFAMCMESWGRSSFARAMIELRADVELKDTIIVSVPKLVGEGFSMYMMCGCRKDFYTKFYNSLGSVPNRCSVV
ncbi:hypothetical protein Tco_1008659 [Tanacetum coccineum]